MRKLFSISKSLWQLPVTKSAVTGVPSGQAARLVTWPLIPARVLALLIDAAQRPAGPAGLVLAVDLLVVALRAGAGGPGLGEYVPVGDLSPGCSCRHLSTWQGTPGTFMPRMNDSPAASIAFWFASEIIPASATTVTPGSRRAATNFPVTGSIVLVSALLPSKALTMSGNTSCPVSSPPSRAYSGRRRLTVAYDAGTTPASSSTRKEPSLLTGSMILGSTR
jgi:hypothetical protein